MQEGSLVHVRATGAQDVGGRDHNEDHFRVHFGSSTDGTYPCNFFAVFDGHGGEDAALYARNHLLDVMKSEEGFFSRDDSDVANAIRRAFLKIHASMKFEHESWPSSRSGYASTAGTTASVSCVRGTKLYIGHVGDSGIVLGYQTEGSEEWIARKLTKDHKPDDDDERARIETSGGRVMPSRIGGAMRVVWNRPTLPPAAKAVERIPFLAISRSLGDFWSFNEDTQEYVVSPFPDTHVVNLDARRDRCMILGTDGLWDVMTPQSAVQIVQTTEEINSSFVYAAEAALQEGSVWQDPSKALVTKALALWKERNLAADNVTAVVVYFDMAG